MSVAKTADMDSSDDQHQQQIPNTHEHEVVDIQELLSTCIDACRRGCEVIRNVRHKSLHSTDILDSVQYKIFGDPRSALTEADGASQKVIIECLNNCWETQLSAGKIKIVGEEEEDNYSTDLEGDKSFDTAYSEDIMNHFDNYNSPRPDVEPMLRYLFGASTAATAATGASDARGSSTRTRVVTSKDDQIVIFIDPMDGTREFVEGRIQNVQCLIGITLNGLPVAGAMGLPMVHGDQVEIAYGMISPNKSGGGGSSSSGVVSLLSGVKFFDAVNPLDIHSVIVDDGKNASSSDGNSKHEDDDGTLLVYSGDSKKPALKMAMESLENSILAATEPGNDQQEPLEDVPPFRRILVGGCGNKMLNVQRHAQSLSQRQEEKYAATSCCITDLLPGMETAQPKMVGAISVAGPGSSSWDTAAPTAVLLAADPNARVTDLIGRPLIYDGEELMNKCGIVVSSGCVASSIHGRLCEILCKDQDLCESIGLTVGGESLES